MIDLQGNKSVGGFCSGYDYEGCKNDPECVWCLERAAEAGVGAGCIHLSRPSVVHVCVHCIERCMSENH